MSDILRRSISPVAEAAWALIDETARQILKAHLSARTVVDLDGPHGWSYGAVDLGRIEIAEKSGADEVPWAVRKVLPLIELRVEFSLSQQDLDDVSRGCKDPDLAPLEQVARKVALFEESAIYNGFAAGQITGILEASGHEPVGLPAEVRQLPRVVSAGIRELRSAGFAGPYTLVLGSEMYDALKHTGEGGYPPRRIVRDMLQGEILWSPALSGGVLLSTESGNFELSVGQDLSIGYASHDRERVHLYLTESFTFRVLNPLAAIELRRA